MNSAIKRLAGQTAIYGLSNIVGRLLNYLLVPLHTYLFSQAQYGTITEFYAYSSFLFVIYTYGMETAFFRFSNSKENTKEVWNTAMLSLLITSLLFSASLFIAANSIAQWLGYEHQRYYIQWFAIIMAADTLCVIPFANLRLQNKPLRYATLKLLNIGITVSLNLIFLLYLPKSGYLQNWFPASIAEGYVFLANLIASGVTVLFFLNEYRHLQFRFNKALLSEMLRYAWPLIIIGTAGMINETLDRILLKIFLPFDEQQNLAQIGIYGACYKLSILMTLFIQAYRMAAEPYFFNESKKEDARITYAHTMSAFVAVCCFIFLGIMMNLEVLKYFIDKKFHEGLFIVPVLLMANMCLGIYYNLSIWYKLSNKTLSGAYIAIAGALVTLALNIWWIPIYGYAGSAWATLCCYAFMMLISFFAGQRYYPVPYETGKVLLMILSTLSAWLIYQKFLGDLFEYNKMLFILLNLILLLMIALLMYRFVFKKAVVQKPMSE